MFRERLTVVSCVSTVGTPTALITLVKEYLKTLSLMKNNITKDQNLKE